MSKLKKTITTIVALLIAAGYWALENIDFNKLKGKIGRGGVEVIGETTQVGDYDRLSGCTLVDHRNNDGDSFLARHDGKDYEFRLYFVDTPESQYKTYRGGESNGQRIAEQGDYFGGLNQASTTTVGQAGKALVKKILSKNDFQVLTKWEDVYGPDRQYCLVVVPWEGQHVYLHELLVASGLARIHTRGADLPKGRSYREQKSSLKTLESTARSKKIGAWGL